MAPSAKHGVQFVNWYKGDCSLSFSKNEPELDPQKTVSVKRRMASWVEISADSDFSLRNLPYGVFSTASLSPRIGTAVGLYMLDLKALAEDDVFSSIPFDASSLEKPTLNEYASLGKDVHLAVRQLLLELLKKDNSLGSVLRDNKERRQRVLLPLSDVKMHLPMQIGDYTDFFVGVHHARNVSIPKDMQDVLNCS